MKLLKFNLLFLPLLALALGVVSLTARGLLRENAREQIVQNARIMMETATSSRTYTTKKIAPLLQQKNFKIQSAIAEFQKMLDELPKDADPVIPKDVHYASAKKAYMLGQQKLLATQQQLIAAAKDKPAELLDVVFRPESVPAFAATEIFNYLNAKYPDYFYKEATLNPTNPVHRSSDWETDIINQFRGNAALLEYLGTRETPTGTALVLARPIQIKSGSCLACHSTPDKAPPEMLKLYSDKNGFGWKMDEIIGAQVVSVPMSLPVGLADATWKRLTLWLGGAFVAIALAGNAGVFFLTGRGA